MARFDEHATLRAVIECALEGRLGSVRYDDREEPAVARIDLGCYTIFSGEAGHPLASRWIEELSPPVEILAPETRGWRDRIERLLGDRCTDRTMRTFSAHDLDEAHLRTVAALLPGGFRTEVLDLDLARRLDDHVQPHALQTFPSPEALVEHGFGFAVVAPDGRIAAQTSSYAISSRRVEIAIGTHPEFRRLGLARAAGARMVLACLERGLSPDWSAANPVSKRLARSLGYRPAGLCDILFYE